MKKHILQIAVGLLLVVLAFFWPQLIGISQSDKNKTVTVPVNPKDKITDEIVAKTVETRKVEVANQKETILILKRKLRSKNIPSKVYLPEYKVPGRQTVKYKDTCIDNNTDWKKKGLLQRIFKSGQ